MHSPHISGTRLRNGHGHASFMPLHEHTAHPARISVSDAIRGNIARDDAPGTDDGTVTDRDSGADDDAAAEPDIVPDGDGLCNAAGTALFRIDGMRRRINLNIRGDPATVADLDSIRIENRAVEIKITAVPDKNIFAEVAVERRLDVDIAPDRAEKFTERLFTDFNILQFGIVDCMHQPLAGETHAERVLIRILEMNAVNTAEAFFHHKVSLPSSGVVVPLLGVVQLGDDGFCVHSSVVADVVEEPDLPQDTQNRETITTKRIAAMDV